MNRTIALPTQCSFVGGSIDAHPEICDRCDTTFYDPSHVVSMAEMWLKTIYEDDASRFIADKDFIHALAQHFLETEDEKQNLLLILNKCRNKLSDLILEHSCWAGGLDGEGVCAQPCDRCDPITAVIRDADKFVLPQKRTRRLDD